MLRYNSFKCCQYVDAHQIEPGFERSNKTILHEMNVLCYVYFVVCKLYTVRIKCGLKNKVPWLAVIFLAMFLAKRKFCNHVMNVPCISYYSIITLQSPFNWILECMKESETAFLLFILPLKSADLVCLSKTKPCTNWYIYVDVFIHSVKLLQENHWPVLLLSEL